MKVRLTPAAMGEVAFFAVFLGYVQGGIDTRLIYHWQAPAFYWTREFLLGFVRRAGGPADYLYAFLAQAYLWPWWGAIVLTAQAWAVTRLTDRCFRGLTGRWPGALRFLPALALLFLANLYHDRSPVALELLIGLGAAAGCIAAGGRFALVGLPLLMAAAFYLGGPAILFCAPGAAMTFSDAAERRGFGTTAAALLLGALLPLTLPDARSWFAGSDTRAVAVRWALYAFYVAAPVGLLFLRRTRILEGRVAGAMTALALAAVTVSFYRMNARDRELSALDLHTQREDWAAVLEIAERLPAGDFNSLTRYEINLALHETGRLGDEMFRFPQSGSPLPSLLPNAFLPYALRQADLCLRLGRVNDAERFGSEAAILGGRDPRVYRVMADVNLVKGQTAVAGKFLRVLTDAGGYREEARRSLREMDSGARIQALRRRMLRTDDVLPVWQRADRPEGDVERLLLDQLAQDPTNRMAFEFLMAARLAARDLPGVAALMPWLKDLGLGRTPRHYQEAMAMYAENAGGLPAIDGFAMESDTLNRLAVFKRIVRQGPTRDAAFQGAWESHRRSYFFYFVFGPGDYR